MIAKKAVVAGATGSVGRLIVKTCVEDPRIDCTSVNTIDNDDSSISDDSATIYNEINDDIQAIDKLNQDFNADINDALTEFQLVSYTTSSSMTLKTKVATSGV